LNYERFWFSNLELIEYAAKKFIGANKLGHSNRGIEDVLDAKALKYQINEGDGAFYGPKIDVKLKMLWRAWQCARVQCDFNLPERFALSFINEKGNKSADYVAVQFRQHGTVHGMIEHYAGAFPTWFSADANLDYSNS